VLVRARAATEQLLKPPPSRDRAGAPTSDGMAGPGPGLHLQHPAHSRPMSLQGQHICSSFSLQRQGVLTVCLSRDTVQGGAGPVSEPVGLRLSPGIVAKRLSLRGSPPESWDKAPRGLTESRRRRESLCPETWRLLSLSLSLRDKPPVFLSLAVSTETGRLLPVCQPECRSPSASAHWHSMADRVGLVTYKIHV
jgi:hypothetical protein